MSDMVFPGKVTSPLVTFYFLYVKTREVHDIKAASLKDVTLVPERLHSGAEDHLDVNRDTGRQQFMCIVNRIWTFGTNCKILFLTGLNNECKGKH